jgi:aminoglycoside/choline kinase family phosphotransferase
MNHILDEDEQNDFIRQMETLYRNYKHINSGNWTNECSYKEGIVDFCDALIDASSRITYDVSHLRMEVEDMIDRVDSEVKK